MTTEQQAAACGVSQICEPRRVKCGYYMLWLAKTPDALHRLRLRAFSQDTVGIIFVEQLDSVKKIGTMVTN